MAKYIGTLTSDARGKVGGIVFSRGRNGTNLRAHVIPINPSTALQTGVRGTLAASQGAWRALNAFQRTSWQSFASYFIWANPLGQLYTPTGLQLWAQAYINAAAFGTTPPATWSGAVPILAPLVALALTRYGYDLYCAASDAGGYHVAPWILYSSGPVSPVVNYVKKTSRKFMFSTYSSVNVQFSAPYVDAYGVLPAIGRVLALRGVAVDATTFISATPLTVAIPVLS
jgi:hypothetical protein